MDRVDVVEGRVVVVLNPAFVPLPSPYPESPRLVAVFTDLGNQIAPWRVRSQMKSLPPTALCEVVPFDPAQPHSISSSIVFPPGHWVVVFVQYSAHSGTTVMVEIP